MVIDAEPLLQRLSIKASGLSALVAIGTCITCFVIAGPAILASATGFITYRTIAVPTAIPRRGLAFRGSGHCRQWVWAVSRRLRG